MGESLRMAMARRLKKLNQQEPKKDPEELSPLQVSSEPSPSSYNKGLTSITKSLPSTALWSLGKNIANKTVKTFKDLLGCLGLDDEVDVVDPRTVRTIAKQHHKSQNHQQSIPKGKDSFSFPRCPTLPIDQPWAQDPSLVANKDALWIIFYHFSDSNHKEPSPYITVPKIQELLSVESICLLSISQPSLTSPYSYIPLSSFTWQICGVLPALVTSRDLSTILTEDIGEGELRSDRLSFVVFVEVLWHIAERALIIIPPEQPESTSHNNNLRFAMVIILMSYHSPYYLPSSSPTDATPYVKLILLLTHP